MKRFQNIKKRVRDSNDNHLFSFRYWLSTSLFTLGVLCIAYSLLLRHQYASRLDFQGTYQDTEKTEFDPSIRTITISKLLLTLPVTQTTITEGNWEIAADGVSHLVTSSSPGKTGNIVLYAHNSVHLFGSLKALSVGDTIQLVTSDGVVHEYIVDTTHEVSPDMISVVSQTPKEILTLYTCTGFADSKRFVVHAIPKYRS